MSFRCRKCKQAQPAGVRPIRVVTKYAEREYGLDHAGSIILGWEILAEENVCQGCYDQLDLVDKPQIKEAS